MSSNFYRAFEDKYRGSQDLIKSRLKVYLPFIEPLKEVYEVCKRAIWLGKGVIRMDGASADVVDHYVKFVDGETS